MSGINFYNTKYSKYQVPPQTTCPSNTQSLANEKLHFHRISFINSSSESIHNVFQKGIQKEISKWNGTLPNALGKLAVNYL